MTASKLADTATPLHPLLAERWSPRGFHAEHRLDEKQLLALLEAARWAPSANNSQPWRFVVANRGDASFDLLTSILAEGNRTWAIHASALILVAAQTVTPEGKPIRWAHYDTGQAVAALTVQAQADGLSVHQMGGYDADAARAAFDLPETVVPVVVLAIGEHDPDADLPEPFASRERAARSRLPLDSLMLTPPLARR